MITPIERTVGGASTRKHHQSNQSPYLSKLSVPFAISAVISHRLSDAIILYASFPHLRQKWPSHRDDSQGLRASISRG
jgi:hypothetical protein